MMGVYNNIILGINIRWPCNAINKYSIALHLFYRIHNIFVSRGHQKRIDFDSTVATTATAHSGAKYKKDGILRQYSGVVVVCAIVATTTVLFPHSTVVPTATADAASTNSIGLDQKSAWHRPTHKHTLSQTNIAINNINSGWLNGIFMFNYTIYDR